MKKILIVVGTRPNFIKITRFPIVLKEYEGRLDYKIVHTGQHFDSKMSTVFFDQFGFQPDIFLNIGQGSANTQMANIMLGLEKTIEEYKPDLMIVVGDVNSTFAAALTANKMNVSIAHLESGLRSFDRTMPEEINRILTDEITEHFFITEQSGVDNLISERKKDNLHFVGNTMIDSLIGFREQIDQSEILKIHGLKEGDFVLMTMHRPATVDNRQGLTKLIELIEYISKEHKLVFPIHPRTLNKLETEGLSHKLKSDNIILLEPLDYFSFQKLVKSCRFILTDSGGIQEESTYYRVPCLTLRPNTERPSTISLGTNELVPFEMDMICPKVKSIIDGTFKKGEVPPLWDGKTTERIVKILDDILNQ